MDAIFPRLAKEAVSAAAGLAAPFVVNPGAARRPSVTLARSRPGRRAERPLRASTRGHTKADKAVLEVNPGERSNV